jgi:F0F1-type ATP synthase assembly protein I
VPKKLSRPIQRQPFSPKIGLGFAYRLGIEFMSGILVGLLLGYAVDRLWGTQPWGLVAMVLLGSAAGLLNIFRMLGLWGRSVAKTSSLPLKEEKDG